MLKPIENKDNKPLKCSKESFCYAMDSVAENNIRAKGLIRFEVISRKTGQYRVLGVLYKTGARDKGLMLNVCPWCGCNIQFFDESEVSEKKG